MSWAAPSVGDFKTFFARDFNFAPDTAPNDLSFVTDADVQKAIDEGQINFNVALFGSDAQVTIVFMYLAAFLLVFNIQNSTKGLSSQSKFPISSSSVGGVAVNYQIPDRYSKDPVISQFAANGYGMKYLSFALPLLVGNVGHLPGTVSVGYGWPCQ